MACANPGCAPGRGQERATAVAMHEDLEMVKARYEQTLKTKLGKKDAKLKQATARADEAEELANRIAREKEQAVGTTLELPQSQHIVFFSCGLFYPELFQTARMFGRSIGVRFSVYLLFSMTPQPARPTSTHLQGLSHPTSRFDSNNPWATILRPSS